MENTTQWERNQITLTCNIVSGADQGGAEDLAVVCSSLFNLFIFFSFFLLFFHSFKKNKTACFKKMNKGNFFTKLILWNWGSSFSLASIWSSLEANKNHLLYNGFLKRRYLSWTSVHLDPCSANLSTVWPGKSALIESKVFNSKEEVILKGMV